MKQLNQTIEALRLQVSNHSAIATKVSASDVGWHIDHCLIIMENVLIFIKDSQPKDYSSTFSWKKAMVLKLGFIPRGKVRAPKAALPISYDESSLIAKVNKVKLLIDSIGVLEANQYFRHPFLGDLNVKETIKFLAVHTHHHQKIINDILSF